MIPYIYVATPAEGDLYIADKHGGKQSEEENCWIVVNSSGCM